MHLGDHFPLYRCRFCERVRQFRRRRASNAIWVVSFSALERSFATRVDRRRRRPSPPQRAKHQFPQRSRFLLPITELCRSRVSSPRGKATITTQWQCQWKWTIGSWRNSGRRSEPPPGRHLSRPTPFLCSSTGTISWHRLPQGAENRSCLAYHFSNASSSRSSSKAMVAATWEHPERL